MQRSLSGAFGLLLLSACTAQPVNVTNDLSSSRSSSLFSSVPSVSSVSSNAEIEAFPSTLSIPHFSTMRLSGTGLTLVKVLERNSVYTRHEIRYQSNGLTISGILNIPNGDGPYPVLVFNHGFIDPSVYTLGRGLKREQDYMARQGFAVLHTDYRGHAASDPRPNPERLYEGNLEYAIDSVNAILALQAAKLPQIDASRVGMLGHSLGGGVTLAILTAHPELVDAAVLYAPVHADVWQNFLRWRDNGPEGDATREAFGSKEESPEFWAQLSPQTFLEDVTAPVMLFHGDRDKDVPKPWSDDLATRLTDLGKAIEYVEYTGEGHEFGPQWGDFMRKAAEFYRENL